MAVGLSLHQSPHSKLARRIELFEARIDRAQASRNAPLVSCERSKHSGAVLALRLDLWGYPRDADMPDHHAARYAVGPAYDISRKTREVGALARSH
jgi:hypothetical protein